MANRHNKNCHVETNRDKQDRRTSLRKQIRITALFPPMESYTNLQQFCLRWWPLLFYPAAIQSKPFVTSFLQDCNCSMKLVWSLLTTISLSY